MLKQNFEFYFKISDANKNAPYFGCIYKDEIRKNGSFESTQGEALSNFFLVLEKKDKIHLVYKPLNGKIVLPSDLRKKLDIDLAGIEEKPESEFTVKF